jgi:site-specific DNA-methyltransferase (adenine-specific)
MDKRTQSLMFENNKDNWETPEYLYEWLNRQYKFTLDPCADDLNHKCEKYFTEKDDGLKQTWWGESVFCNPPYSQLKKWLEKGHDEHCDGERTTCIYLTAARTDCRVFHETCMKADKIIFLKGRVKFVGAQHCAPFPSMIVCFDGSNPDKERNGPIFETANLQEIKKEYVQFKQKNRQQ